MQRIPNPPSNQFVDGNPSTATQGTIVSAAWLNAIQEELAYVIEQAGLVLSSGNQTQLKAGISALFGAGRLLRISSFQTPGTFTWNCGADVGGALVYVVSGGGGGGASVSTAIRGGGGGAGGSIGIKYINQTSLPASVSVTVGGGGTGAAAGSGNVGNSGGSSSFGSFVSVAGGGGGGGSSTGGGGGSPGGISGADVSFLGGSGTQSAPTANSQGGFGGSSVFAGLTGSSDTVGFNGYNGGGGGSAAAANYAAGNGGNGVVLIYEYSKG